MKTDTCEPVDPPTECVWGYRLGELVSDTIYEVVQRKEIDGTDALNYFKCFTSETKTKQNIKLKCFEESLGD